MDKSVVVCEVRAVVTRLISSLDVVNMIPLYRSSDPIDDFDIEDPR